MEWLNYHHLLYFHTVATEGSIARASEKLRLASSTISIQIKELEESLGEDLFHRVGRRLELTEYGRVALTYADEIFSLGREMLDTLRSQPTGRPLRLRVGIADVVPKLMAFRVVQPVLEMEHPVKLICHEGDVESLLSQLAIHKLDVVLSDAPLGPHVSIQAFNHLLGESEVKIFGAPELAEAYMEDFPMSLDRAPMLMPTGRNALRRHLEGYFKSQAIRPHTVAEFDDRALMKVFGEEGLGLFPAPAFVEDSLRAKCGVVPLGALADVKERYYALTLDRRIKHPAVQVISQSAKQEMATDPAS